jgi:hypothetical protein
MKLELSDAGVLEAEVTLDDLTFYDSIWTVYDFGPRL